MIPLSDNNPTRITPYVTYIVIALNVLVYIGELLHLQALEFWPMIPYSVIHNVQVAPYYNQLGQFAGYAQLPPQWLTLFTSMFMHGGFMHIAGNMLYLWIFGNNIEDALGHIKFVLFYLATGVLAGLTHIMSGPNSLIPLVGASGAIAGVLGAYLILYPGQSIRTLITLPFYWDYVEIPAVYVLGAWFVVQLTNIAGSSGIRGGGVAYWAHVGGFVAGIVLIMIMGGRKLGNTQQGQRPRRDGRLSRWAR